jgi:hypothetical protein
MRTFRELPTWVFNVSEVSSGVYEVVGRDTSGRRIETRGAYVESLLAECRYVAGRLAAGLASADTEPGPSSEPGRAIEVHVARSWSGARVRIHPREGRRVARALAQ